MTAAAVLHIEGDRLHMPASAWQLAGFRSWVTSDQFPVNVRASFVRGEVFLEMSPESTESHNKVKTEITAELARIVRDEDLGELYSDRTLLTHADAELSTEPDAMVVSWSSWQSGKVTLVPRAERADEYIELVGSPDLVVEIVSDSSERKDLVQLRAAYEQARVAEYWVIDARGPQLSFVILALDDHGYQPALDPSGNALSRFFGRSFTLRRERNRLGRWRYRLETVGGL